MEIKKVKIYGSILLYFGIGLILMVNFPITESKLDTTNYLFLLFTYFIIGAFVLYKFITENIYIFEPYTLITLLYFAIFIIRPMSDIVNNDMVVFGVDVSEGCIKASIIFMISYFTFCYGYFRNRKREYYKYTELSSEQIKKSQGISLFIWLCCFIMTLLYFKLSGKGIMMIFTLQSNNNIQSDGTSVGFLSNFAYSMFVPMLYILFYNKGKFVKLLVFGITALCFLAMGFRFPLIILLVSPIVYYYTKRKKSPPTSMLILVSTILLIMAGMVGYFRVGLRQGFSTDWSNFGISNITYVFDSDLTIYKPFYSMVTKFPSEHDFYYGEEMIWQTLTLIIPRALWPGKPEPLSGEIISYIVNDMASRSAQAYPSLASLYVEFGLIGCVVGMYLLGRLANRIRNMYLVPTYHSLILYAVLWPSILQLVIRNYIPSLVYLLIFIWIPSFIIKKMMILQK